MAHSPRIVALAGASHDALVVVSGKVFFTHSKDLRKQSLASAHDKG